MNWFKHKTDEHQSITLSDAYGLFGHTGYKFYFILHEIYAKYYDQRNDNDFIEISQKNLSRINNINETKVKQLLDYYKERNKITFFMVHGIVCYKIVGFNKLHSKWQDRKEKKLSTNEENPTVEVEEEVEAEVEEEKIKEREKRRRCERNYEEEAHQILEALNKATGRDYNDTRYIVPLLKKGKKFEDFILIILNKCNDDFFIKNPKLMTPKTLFKEEMFDIYANENKEKKAVNYHE